MVVVIGRHQHFRQDEYHGYNQKLGDYLHQALLSGRWFAVVRNIFIKSVGICQRTVILLMISMALSYKRMGYILNCIKIYS